MKEKFIALVLLSLAAATACAQSTPYAGQQERAIKALSEQEVADYLAGKSMGLAKTAELNGCPGPAHVTASIRSLGLHGG